MISKNCENLIDQIKEAWRTPKTKGAPADYADSANSAQYATAGRVASAVMVVSEHLHQVGVCLPGFST